MKNRIRKLMAIVLAAVSIFSAAAPAAGMGGVFQLVASAADAEEYTSGYYTYIVEDGAATITKVDKSISGNVTIPSTLGGYTVEKIAEEVFIDCENLEELTIPNSVKEANRMATSYWSYTSNIKKVTFLEGRTEIPDGILKCATALETVVIPSTVTRIGDEAFCESGLPSVTIPDATKEIGGGAFAGTKISAIDLKNVEIIGESAFIDCENLEELTIPNSVKEANRMATSYWSYTSNIKKVTFLEGRTEIPNGILEGAKSLESVEIPNTVTKVGKSAFNDCKALTDVYYYGTEDDWNEVVIESGNDPLLNATIHYIECPSYLHYEIVNGEAIIVDCDKEASGNIRIPQKLEGCPVTEIGQSAFHNCKDITGVVIPDTVKIIDEAAFDYCESLKEVKMSANIESIGVTAFTGCCIDSLELPKTLKTIGAGAFYEPQPISIDYKAMIEYGIENGTIDSEEVKDVDEFVRELENELKDFSVQDIMRIFSYDMPGEQFGVYAPTKVTIDKNNPYLCNDSQGIIYNKDKTKVFTVAGMKNSYVIPDSVKEIGEAAFVESFKAQSITIPEGVTTIGECAFMSCVALKEITIPASVTTMGYGIFEYCESLEKVTIKDGVTEIAESAFKDCTSLKEITIPESVTTIGENAFWKCDKLTIYCYADSAAHKYAEENNIKYVLLVHPVKSVKISDVTVKVGNTAVITPEIVYGDDKNCTVAFTSSDASVAKVDNNGKVEGFKAGKAKITCTVTDEHGNTVKDTCTVTVNAVKIEIPGNIEVQYNSPAKITPEIDVENIEDYTITYKSSDDSVATVDSNGNITTHHKGTATITCTVSDKNNHESTAKFTVNVKFKWWQWLIWIFLFGFLWY